MKEYIFYIILSWNFITFLIYGADKWRAKHNAMRISEKTLILSSFCIGSIGALLGMKIFRHKTQHVKFKLLIPLSAFIHLAIIIAYFYLRQEGFFHGI